MTHDDKRAILYRAWAGGVFDARITFPKAGYTLSFDTINKSLADRFLEVIGFGLIEEIGRKDMKNMRYRYRVTTMDDTRELLLFVSPFLTSKNLALAGQLVAKIERNKTWQKKHPEKADEVVNK